MKAKRGYCPNLLYTVHNRDQPENIDHELWMDTDQPLPTLNLFSVSAVNDMTVSNNDIFLTFPACF